jgi:acyl dehydratase
VASVSPRLFAGIDDLRSAVGSHLGYSDWHTIRQEQINQFADATGDHQWIHVDPERAKAGPFGTTIAHGFLTLSLLPVLTWQIYRVDGVGMFVNYGLNRVRFPAPAPAGSAVRAGAELLELTDIDGGVQAVSRVTVEVRDQPKPVCVAETVSRLYV